MKVYFWCPFISNVATTSAVINSIKSIKNFSNTKIDCKIINVFKEWDELYRTIVDYKIDLLDLNIPLDIKNLPKGNFIKSRITYLITFIFSLLKLHLLLKKNKPDFLIIHLITSIPLSLLMLFNYETKFILRISGYPKLNFWRSFLWKFTAKKINKIFCPTLLTKNLLIKKKIFSSDKLFVVKDPVIDVAIINAKKKKKLDKNFEWLKDKKYIISVGRLTKQKNYKFLIKNFNNILNFFPDLCLVILGEGEERDTLEKIIKKNDLKEKVFLVGKKNNIYPFLSNALFFILTSKWEDPGFVILESMFVRKIVLSSDCKNGPIEIIKNRDNGFLYKNNDTEDFNKSFYDIMKVVNSDVKKKNTILVSALKKTKSYSLMGHYKDISPHLK
jgi:glycosyltransferase involved in cell wall biosynthesis